MNFWDTVLGNELARTLIRFMQNNNEIGEELQKLNNNLEKLNIELEKINSIGDNS